MKRHLLFFCVVLTCWACGGNDHSHIASREWLPEPDIADRLRYQKNQLDSLSADENTQSEIWVQRNNASPILLEGSQEPVEEAINYMLVRDASGRLVYISQLSMGNTYVQTHYFDEEGSTFAYQQHRALPTGCNGKYVMETLILYYDKSFTPIEKERFLLDQNGKVLSPDNCNLPEPALPTGAPNLDTYLRQHKLKVE